MSPRKIRKSSKMEDASLVRRWEDLDIDILVKIFMYLDMFQLTSGAAHVCSSWRKVCRDRLIWKTLDLSMHTSVLFKVHRSPHVCIQSHAEKKLTKLLKTSLNLSQGKITSMFFHLNLYLSDEQFSYTAERTPMLRRLVMPSWNRIGKTSITKAIRTWKDLVSLTMPSIYDPFYLFEELADNCRNFCELKVMGPVFRTRFTNALVAYLPKLRVLSLRCSVIDVEDLIYILDSLRHLEVLNISHALIIEYPEPPLPKRILTVLDQDILEKASPLKEFLTCMDDSCIMCQRMRYDEGFLRWYMCEEGQWKADEASSLAL